jgi:hypothetical protein
MASASISVDMLTNSYRLKGEIKRSHSDASLGAILFPQLLIQSPVILINRAFFNTLLRIDQG